MTTEDSWVTIEEIATRLHVHPETVRRWLRKGTLPGRNFGGRMGYRVLRSEYEAFVTNGMTRVDVGETAE